MPKLKPGTKWNPKTKKYETASVATKPPEPVRQQIKDMTGSATLAELKEQLPESTAAGPVAPDERQRRPRKPKTESEVDPNMSDPRYAKAVSRMTAFGGARAIKTGFKFAAAVTEKPDVALTPEESEEWEDFFYVVGKKSNFDPSRPWYLILFSVLLLGEHVVTRLWKYNQNSFTAELSKFFGFGPKEEPEPDQRRIGDEPANYVTQGSTLD